MKRLIREAASWILPLGDIWITSLATPSFLPSYGRME